MCNACAVCLVRSFCSTFWTGLPKLCLSVFVLTAATQHVCVVEQRSSRLPKVTHLQECIYRQPAVLGHRDHVWGHSSTPSKSSMHAGQKGMQACLGLRSCFETDSQEPSNRLCACYCTSLNIRHSSMLYNASLVQALSTWLQLLDLQSFTLDSYTNDRTNLLPPFLTA